MTTVLDSFDTPMLDYHPDTDVQMHTNSDPWFHEEALMEDEDARSSSHGDLVDVEIEMENYLEEDAQGSNPEYDMVDEAINDADPEDVIVVDASHQASAHDAGSLEAVEQEEMVSEVSPVVDVEAAFVSPFPVDIVAVAATEPTEFVSTETSILPLSGSSSEPTPDVMSVPTTSGESAHPDPVSPHAASEESVSHVEAAVPSGGVDLTATGTDYVYVEITTQEDHTRGEETSHSDELVTEVSAPSDGVDNEFDSAAHGHDSSVDEQTGLAEPQSEFQEEQAGSSMQGHLEPAATTSELQEEYSTLENDPHEISEGVYIDPPPAVLLSFATLEHPDVWLFNQPSLSDPSSSTTDPISYAVLLSDQPTLYYEPLSSVFDALRNDAELPQFADLSQGELVLDAYDLQLCVSEDNVFARETSIHDLNVLHDGSDLSGPLRLRLQLNTPRFIVRYRMLQDQNLRLNLAGVNEDNTGDGSHVNPTSENQVSDHETDNPEGVVLEYPQEQEQSTENSLQDEQYTTQEFDETQPQLGAKEADLENASDSAQQRSANLVSNSATDEDNVVAVSYDDDSHREFDEADASDLDEPYEDAQNDAEDEAQDAPDLNGEGPFEALENDDGSNEQAEFQEETYKLEYENENDDSSIVGTGNSIVPDVPLESQLVTESDNNVSEEVYQGEDLYYDDNVDAEWDGTEYEDEVADDVEGTVITSSADHESASVQSSATLSSRHSKRSIDDVEEGEEEDLNAVTSIHSSPGSKRARVE